MEQESWMPGDMVWVIDITYRKDGMWLGVAPIVGTLISIKVEPVLNQPVKSRLPKAWGKTYYVLTKHGEQPYTEIFATKEEVTKMYETSIQAMAKTKI